MGDGLETFLHPSSHYPYTSANPAKSVPSTFRRQAGSSLNRVRTAGVDVELPQ